jgi:hypothetical protein
MIFKNVQTPRQTGVNTHHMPKPSFGPLCSWSDAHRSTHLLARSFRGSSRPQGLYFEICSIRLGFRFLYNISNEPPMKFLPRTLSRPLRPEVRGTSCMLISSVGVTRSSHLINQVRGRRFLFPFPHVQGSARKYEIALYGELMHLWWIAIVEFRGDKVTPRRLPLL